MEKELEYPTQIVLVIDDTALMRAMHRKHLLALGFHEDNIIEADDGLKGFGKLDGILKENKKPSLIICDWDMPVMNGIEFLKKMRMFPPAKDIPFLMVTGHDNPAEVAKLAAAGIGGVLTKPIKIDLYNKKIIELVGKTLGA